MIDSNIAMGVKPVQIDNPMNALAQMLQIQQGQQANQLNQMNMEDRATSRTRSNNLIQLMGGLGENATDEQRITTMKGGGYFDEADKLSTGILNRRKIESDAGKVDAEVLDKNLAAFRSVVPQIRTAEAAGQYTAAMFDHPVLGKFAAQFGNREDVIRRNMEGFTADPRAWAVGSAGISGDKLLESLKGTRQNTNLGGTSQGVTTNYYGEVVPGQTTNTPITQSADNVASNQTSVENNRRTVGASLSNAAATREVAGATRYAANAQRDQGTEMKLADDYRAQSKDFGAASSAYKQISATLDSATTSPAATLAAATKFMKILDPGSVVRESELGMALQASGVLDRAANYMNILQRGKVLTPTQVADFKDISNKMYGAAQQVQQTIDADYQGKAKAYGLRPEMVTQNLGQNDKPAKGKAPATNPQGWVLHTDAKGNKAYVSPDGKQFQEAK